MSNGPAGERHETFDLNCPNCNVDRVVEVFQAQCESYLMGGELHSTPNNGKSTGVLTVYPIYEGTTDSQFEPLESRPIDYVCHGCGFTSPTLLAFRVAETTKPVAPSPSSPLHVVRSGKPPPLGKAASVHREPPARPA